MQKSIFIKRSLTIVLSIVCMFTMLTCSVSASGNITPYSENMNTGTTYNGYTYIVPTAGNVGTPLFICNVPQNYYVCLKVRGFNWNKKFTARMHYYTPYDGEWHTTNFITRTNTIEFADKGTTSFYITKFYIEMDNKNTDIKDFYYSVYLQLDKFRSKSSSISFGE